MLPSHHLRHLAFFTSRTNKSLHLASHRIQQSQEHVPKSHSSANARIQLTRAAVSYTGHLSSSYRDLKKFAQSAGNSGYQSRPPAKSTLLTEIMMMMKKKEKKQNITDSDGNHTSRTDALKAIADSDGNYFDAATLAMLELRFFIRDNAVSSTPRSGDFGEDEHEGDDQETGKFSGVRDVEEEVKYANWFG